MEFQIKTQLFETLIMLSLPLRFDESRPAWMYVYTYVY